MKFEDVLFLAVIVILLLAVTIFSVTIPVGQ
jgi:hypothetical protein